MSELAVRYGAGVEKATSDPEQVYATAEGSGESGRRTGHTALGQPFAIAVRRHSRTLAQLA